MNVPLCFAVPAGRVGVYLIKREGVVVYVGQTRNIWSRLQGHSIASAGDEVEFFPCGVHELNERERAAIALHRPALNVVGVTRAYHGIAKGIRYGGKVCPSIADAVRLAGAHRGGFVSATELRNLGVLGGSYRDDPIVRATFIAPDYSRRKGSLWSVDRVLAMLKTAARRASQHAHAAQS